MPENEESANDEANICIKNLRTDMAIFKKPRIPKLRQKQKILDEDSYVDQIGKIIQRDFFPDLEKLKAQNEYLGAMERNDVSKLRELYAKYSGKRPPTERMPSPATFETPTNIHNSQYLPKKPDMATITEIGSKLEPKFSLDQYLKSHTSQDNQSFGEILEESSIKHMQKYSYLFKEEWKSEEEQRKQSILPTIEQQCLLPERKLNVDTWGYKNRNFIMYVPDGVDLTRERELEINQKRLEIVYNNTRLAFNPFNDSQNKETISELAKTQAKILDGKIGVDGKELVQSDSPKIGGFSLVRSPSPCPGVMASPLMTWGEIEGTPFRLDGSDTPLPRSQGPSFKMSEPPLREQLAFALAEKVVDKTKDKKKKAMDAARKQFATPSPKVTSSLERLATMSPAARRLATSSLKLGTSPNLHFYSPRRLTSPLTRRKTPKTPNRLVAVKRNFVSDVNPNNNNLTDDLLKIKVSKRCKAADFF